MEKGIRSAYIDYNIDWKYDTNLSVIKKDIEELEKLGATGVEITSASEITFYPIIQRLETDEEFQERVMALEEHKKYVKNEEIKLYNKIKTKYNL